MLREYRLTNFKAFGETVTIPIRPLTLIFGANSSGKSSIFQSLLLLKQTLEEAKNPATALLPKVPKGSLVDLGTYSDFVHRHETGRNFEFGARFDLERTDALPPLARKIIESVGAMNAGLTVQFSSIKERTYLRQADLAIGDQRQAIISYFRHRHLYPPTPKHPHERFGYSEEVEIKPELEFWRSLYTCTKRYISSRLEAVEAQEDSLSEKLKNYQFEDAVKDIRDALPSSQVDYENFLPKSHIIYNSLLFQISDNFLTDSILYGSILDNSGLYNWVLNDEDEYIYEVNLSPFVSHICSSFERNLRDLVYLGPLRSRPERDYEFSGDTTDYVGQSGEYMPDILAEKPELVEQTNKDLEWLMKYRLKVLKSQYEDGSLNNRISLRLVDTDTGIDANLPDVGFGIGQVLPVVVQSCLSKKKTLLIEQPEIHLHPVQQAELGDLFIRSALGEQRNTILLETHSEHLMLRILRRIRETSENEPLPEGIPAIRPEDVAVLYVQPGEGDEGAQVIEIPVTEDGDFARLWPEGFFVERSKELF